MRVRGFAEPRLAKFASTLWVGSEEGFIAASFNPGMSPIELNRRQALLICKHDGGSQTPERIATGDHLIVVGLGLCFQFSEP